MEPEVRSALAELNRAFYTRFAGDFARTRRGWPPGFHRILPYLKGAGNVLDAGCGNGRLLAFLIQQGWQGSYLGLDASPELLAVARAQVEATQTAGAQAPESEATNPGQLSARFRLADLLVPDWAAQTEAWQPAAIAALAVLHHIPGADQRQRFVGQCAALLPADGCLLVSTWQFAAAPRLRRRILPWEHAGLRATDVEPGDYLLSWGQGAVGRRYCALIGPDELRCLAEEAGLVTQEMFCADGMEGDLNLYGIFRRPRPFATSSQNAFAH